MSAPTPGTPGRPLDPAVSATSQPELVVSPGPGRVYDLNDFHLPTRNWTGRVADWLLRPAAVRAALVAVVSGLSVLGRLAMTRTVGPLWAVPLPVLLLAAAAGGCLAAATVSSAGDGPLLTGRTLLIAAAVVAAVALCDRVVFVLPLLAAGWALHRLRRAGRS